LVTRVFLILFPDPFPYLIWEQGRAGREARVKNSNVQAESHAVQKAYKSRLGVLWATNCDKSQWQRCKMSAVSSLYPATRWWWRNVQFNEPFASKTSQGVQEVYEWL